MRKKPAPTGNRIQFGGCANRSSKVPLRANIRMAGINTHANGESAVTSGRRTLPQPVQAAHQCEQRSPSTLWNAHKPTVAANPSEKKIFQPRVSNGLSPAGFAGKAAALFMGVQ